MINRFNKIILEESKKDYYINLRKKVYNEYEKYNIYPIKEQIFNSLKLTPFEDVRVVIIGQDPYHGIGQAHGLAFSVNKGVDIPPSLKNIYKELNRDLKLKVPNHGNLEKWAKQGVLLLNSVLTVRKDTPSSHKNIGWEIFTDNIIKKLNEKEEPIVFMLWGNFAKQKKKYITNTNHLILETTHPSPFSFYSGFYGCSHFSKANSFLKEKYNKEIDWQIEDI